MKSVRDLIDKPSVWLRGDGPESEIVSSSRVRFARNVAGNAFPERADPSVRAALLARVLEESRHVQLLADALHLNLEPVERVERRLLSERQLVSAELVRAAENRGVVLTSDESLSFMINEEDHLRIQSMCSGLDLERAYEAGDALDTELDARLDFAYSDTYGFLTACPTNAGTGMRASVLMHLPALVLDQKIEAVLQDLKASHFTARGLHGEGSAALGNFFQISNAVTLGLREAEILRNIDRMVHQIIQREMEAREELTSRARSLLEDRIWRSFGILSQARQLSAQETLHHVSLLRLGSAMGIVDLQQNVLNEVLGLSQEAHTQLWSGTNGNEMERNVWRAERVRNKLRRPGA